MHDRRTVLENRINRELYERILPAVVRESVPLEVTAHELSGEPVAVGKVLDADFSPIISGARWGRPWGTVWFHATGALPQRLADPAPGTLVELAVELGFSGSMAGFQAEGAIYVDGRLVSGVHPRRRQLPLDLVTRDGRVDILAEAAANVDFVSSFGPNPGGSLRTAGTDPIYTFGGISFVVIDTEVRDLVTEIQLANELMRTFPLDHPRRKRLLHLFGRTYDAIDVDDVAGTAAAARAELAPAFANPAPAGAHRVTAVGHAHLDTAWLWPMRETVRKAARTFANAVDLMDRHPEYRFVGSQAVHYSWVERDHPELFARLTEKVAEGRFVPVGGMWVEPDVNLPSGESLVRQLVQGQRYFESRFGRRCSEVWIPDVFGYPAGLPQIFVAGGCTRFVTQKLSWNKQNRFPHNTFWWEGVDGTAVLAHFPPVDTYNAEVVPRELSFSVTNFRDHEWSDHSLMPFGYGDGGGGPTREMIERAAVLADVEGLPHLSIGSPESFFDAVEAEAHAAGDDVPRWRGELYFETHRGTFTSQSNTKVGNRRAEELLREAELWLATLGDDSQQGELEELWRTVLVNQFHDILPGSSISWVHEDAERDLARVADGCRAIIGAALERLTAGRPALANTSSRARDEVALLPADLADDLGDGPRQALADGSVAARVAVPALGLTTPAALAVTDRLEAEERADGSLCLASSAIQVVIDAEGDVTSLLDRRVGRELLPTGRAGPRLTLAPDHPVEYDAWDLEEWTAALAQPLGPAASVELVDAGPLLASVRVRHSFGSSEASLTYVLRAGSARLDVVVEVDWHESEKLLALDLPLDVRADVATCEVQFGLERRPTHRNTTWDAAKFEVCAHRFVDLSEPGFGVAVLNDGRYGHAVQDGGIRVSLLRAPRYPDPDADRGRHRTTVAILPHGPGLAEVAAEAEALNLPIRTAPAADGSSADTDLPEPIVAVDDPRVGVSAVKLADDGSGDLVVRVWESLGDRVAVGIRPAGGATSAERCNLLEEPYADAPVVEVVGGAARLELRPFELVTLRLR